MQNALDQNNKEIDQHQETIASLEKQQQKLTVQLQHNTASLAWYLRTQYEQGDMNFSYLKFLLSSNSLYDLYTKTVYVKSIVNYFDKLEGNIKANQFELQNEQQKEQTESEQLSKALTSKLQMRDSLTSALDKQKTMIASLSASEQQTLTQQQQVQNNIDETQRLIQAQEKEAALAAQAAAQKARAAQEAADNAMGKFTAPVSINNGTVNDLLSYARTFLGLPYVFGGDSPVTGFDCSSYVQYVYAHFGIKLNRVTWDQYAEGVSVSQSDLKPGDLVFFTTYAPGASHVGIYIGNRMMVDDSDYGVGYDSLDHPYWAARYYGARRVIAQ